MANPLIEFYTLTVKTDVFKDFGARLRALRKAAGMSQEALAEKAELHYTYVGGIERGERNPSLKNIARLAEALGVKVGEMFEQGQGHTHARGHQKADPVDILSTDIKSMTDYYLSMIPDRTKGLHVRIDNLDKDRFAVVYNEDGEKVGRIELSPPRGGTAIRSRKKLPGVTEVVSKAFAEILIDALKKSPAGTAHRLIKK